MRKLAGLRLLPWLFAAFTLSRGSGTPRTQSEKAFERKTMQESTMDDENIEIVRRHYRHSAKGIIVGIYYRLSQVRPIQL